MNLKILGVLLPLSLVACVQIPSRTGGESSEQVKVGQLKLPVQRLTEPMLFDFYWEKQRCNVANQRSLPGSISDLQGAHVTRALLNAQPRWPCALVSQHRHLKRPHSGWNLIQMQ